MQQIKVPWGHWHEQSTRILEFPDNWEIHYQEMLSSRALNAKEAEEKIDNPIGSEPLEILARGKRSVCIIIDDISRPTPGDFLLPIIIQKLKNCGIEYDSIRVLIALGCHRPMTRQEMQLKVGSWVLEHVQVLNHSPFAADLVTIPDDEQTIKINKVFMDADLRIAVGCIVPHTMAGFSGGAKSVIPGIGGIETLQSNHTLVFKDKNKGMSFKTNTGNPDNAMRENMEHIVEKVGLDFIVNVVINNHMQVADVFAGHFVEAHRAACKQAVIRMRTEIIPDADILILSAYPKDTEYSQVGTCYSVLGHHKKEAVKRDGTIVAMTASSEGAGFHYLFGPQMPLFSPHNDNNPPIELRENELFIFSDGVKSVDIRQFYTENTPCVYQKWGDVLENLTTKYKDKNPVVAIYPMGAIQIGYMSEKKG